jgi:cyclophilin family peptidyl-prolyl cis-trans isomerase
MVQRYLAIVLVLGSLFGWLYFSAQNEHTNQPSVSLSAQVSQVAAEPSIASENSKAVLRTNFGDIELELFERDAPKTVANFLNLAKIGFYANTKFHRVIPNFMIQGGDPNSKDNNWSDDGFGGPGYTFGDEINAHKLVRGVIAMANAGPNTNGSQFFIVTASETPWLDGKHTAFGRVVNGMDVVMKIEKLPRNQNDHPTEDVVILQVSVE